MDTSNESLIHGIGKLEKDKRQNGYFKETAGMKCIWIND